MNLHTFSQLHFRSHNKHTSTVLPVRLFSIQPFFSWYYYYYYYYHFMLSVSVCSFIRLSFKHLLILFHSPFFTISMFILISSTVSTKTIDKITQHEWSSFFKHSWHIRILITDSVLLSFNLRSHSGFHFNSILEVIEICVKILKYNKIKKFMKKIHGKLFLFKNKINNLNQREPQSRTKVERPMKWKWFQVIILHSNSTMSAKHIHIELSDCQHLFLFPSIFVSIKSFWKKIDSNSIKSFLSYNVRYDRCGESCIYVTNMALIKRHNIDFSNTRHWL